MEKLTVKQKRFCLEYLIDCNATQAAVRAGYSKKCAKQIGRENLTKPYLRKYIDEKLKEIESSKIADAKEVLEYLTSVMRGQTQSSVLCMAGNGTQETILKAPDEKERLKACELLGKRYGLFKENINSNVNGEIVIIDNIPDED
ncbi:MAG: terminase small subunit [Erysipelotrichaceae bacterium]|nr:terminase small subunit [Erysipelotrichaceae bacterium]